MAARDAKEPDSASKPSLTKSTASSGNGTILHLGAEMFLDEAAVRARHIPYKGVGPMITDLVGGHRRFRCAGTASGSTPPQKRPVLSGVASRARLAAAPEIPTFAEQGLTGYQVEDGLR